MKTVYVLPQKSAQITKKNREHFTHEIRISPSPFPDDDAAPERSLEQIFLG
jgi:hypothetical protein